MTRPLPPIAHGPIRPSTPSDRVTAVAAGATVELISNGSTVGDAFSDSGGTLWVPLATPLNPGDTIVARQSNADGTSDDSAQPVSVVSSPDPLPAPIFASPLSTCMSSLLLDGLEPGATVRVRHGATIVGTTVATQPLTSVGILPGVSLSTGNQLQAEQELVFNGTTITSPTVWSLPLPLANREQPLPAPGISPPVTACQTWLNFTGMTPSADVTIDNEGLTAQWLNVATAYNGWGAPPFQEGKLVAKQRFPRCSLESPETVVTVGPATAPGKPSIQADPCPSTRRVRIDGLTPNAVVVISTVVPHDTVPGMVVVTPIGEATASVSSEDFDLLLGISTVTASGVPVKLTARQTFCGLPSLDANWITFATPGGPFGPPAVTTPVYECSRRLFVTGAHPSSLLQPRYADSDEPIGDAVMAVGATMSLALWSPLAPGRKVLVRQIGCDADGDSPTAPVTDLPEPLPVPKIVEPVRPKATGVTVVDCIPGARVHLLVDNVVRKSIDTYDPVTVIPTADLALGERQSLWAIQTMCTKTSNFEGHPTVVTRGDIAVSVSPATVQRGSTASVTVSAKDAETTEPINGAQVFLNGSLVGQTGVAFSYSPALGQANPSGTVKEPVAHNDATFSITLVDPPPQPKGKLYLNVGPTVLIPDVLKLVSASWTVSTMWSPVQTLTASGANSFVELPNPALSPADQRVSVTLQTTWEVAGWINGIPFTHQTFSGHMNPNPTLLAWAGTDLTAGWLVQWGIEYDDAGNPWLLVVTNYQGAS